MRDETFSQLERDGWQRNASDYDSVDLPATRQAPSGAARTLLMVANKNPRALLEVA